MMVTAAVARRNDPHLYVERKQNMQEKRAMDPLISSLDQDTSMESVISNAEKQLTEIYQRRMAEYAEARRRLMANGTAEAPRRPLPLIVPGIFSGLVPGAAIRAYLMQREGHSAKVERELLPDLKLGGAAIPGGKKRELHNLRIAIGNNAKWLAYDKDSDTVSLKLTEA